MRRLAGVIFVGLFGCVHPSPVAPAPLPEIWVDASAVDEGDGSVERPFKSLAAALRPGVVLRLRTGMYRGPVELPGDAVLKGEGSVVLFVEAGPVVVKAGRATLENLAIQGGSVGLEVRERVRATRVQLSGQREVAVRVREHASLELIDASLDGNVADIAGVVAGEGAAVTAQNLFVSGAFRRAFETQKASLRLTDAKFMGPTEAVHAVGGTAQLDRVAVAGGRGAGLFFAQATVELKKVEVQGHEYGLLARESTFDVDGFRSTASLLAGMALTGCRGSLKNLTIEDSGSFAAIQLLQFQGTLSEVDIKRAKSAGVLWRDGQGTITGAKVYGVAEEAGSGPEMSGGDAVHLRGVTATVRSVDVRDAHGSGLLATMTASVDIDGLSCNRCGYGVVMVERHAQVRAKRLSSAYNKVTALTVPDVGSLEVFDIDADSSPGTLVYAECAQGAKVKLHRSGVKGSSWTPAPCISVVE